MFWLYISVWNADYEYSSYMCSVIYSGAQWQELECNGDSKDQNHLDIHLHWQK